ncbi:MAG: 3'-5' exonuclease [Kiritimatiellales bacterium]
MIALFQKKPLPQFCADYLAAAKQKPARRTPANSLRFVVLDAETSGFQIKTDHILSIALFNIVSGQIQIESSRKWLVHQPGVGTNAATAIHGILPNESNAGIHEAKVIHELIEILTGAIVVGHHVRFDADMINEAMLRHCKIKFRSRTIDTAQFAMNELTAFHRTGYARQRPPTLDELAAHFDIPVIARHTAEGDAFLTAKLFLLLCGRIRRRTGRAVQLRDLPVRNY